MVIQTRRSELNLTRPDRVRICRLAIASAERWREIANNRGFSSCRGEYVSLVVLESHRRAVFSTHWYVWGVFNHDSSLVFLSRKDGSCDLTNPVGSSFAVGREFCNKVARYAGKLCAVDQHIPLVDI